MRRQRTLDGEDRSVTIPSGRKGGSRFELFRSFLSSCFAPKPRLSPPFHPHSLVSDFLRSVQVGCSRCSRCCHLIFDLCFHLAMEVGPGHRRSHRNSALGAVLPIRKSELCGSRQYDRSAVAQRFVSLSAHPQAMQQHREFSRRRNHRSFLSVLPATLRQLQTPTAQITVRSKRPQNVVRSLHQQGSQIRIAFLVILGPAARETL